MLSHLAIYIVLVYLIRGLLKISSSQVNQVSQQTQDAKLEHQRLLALVNNIGDAVVATDHEGHIQTYNGAALELIDTNKSLTGMYLRDAWKIVDQTGLNVDVIEEARSQNRTIRRSDLMLQYSKNDVANIYINVTPIRIGYGLTSEEGYTLIVRDITKEKSLDEERDEFISVVSHELRTPVTITEGKISNAQLLLSKSNNPDKNIKQSLLESHDQVVFLASMINDLANLSRAERVDSKIPRDKIIPAELVKTLASSYKIEAHQHKLELKTEISPEPIPDLYTSRLYLLEILQNFTTNAFKYTKTGRVTLGVKPTDRNSVTFYVADTGIGVSISDQKRLFEKFFRSEDYRTRESSGTGLGLYVTTKLAQKLGAKLSVNSKLNEGSIFSVTVGSLPDDSNPRD
jgi:PAS domain S-box-containing protein